MSSINIMYATVEVLWIQLQL